MSNNSENNIFDIVVIGAGAAGLMASIMARRSNNQCRVVLLDGRPKVGAKILISGGTRCNVTHQKVTASDYCGGSQHFIRHILAAFDEQKTVDFFKEIGVELVLEPTGKLFPVTHSGRTVLEALLSEADRVGVAKMFGIQADSVDKKDGIFKIACGDEIFKARRVIVATGGLSLPETGSEGAGYRIARHFGHSIIDTFPSLTPLETQDPLWHELSGISFPVSLSYYEQGKKKAEACGSFLFTHFGFSGPVALDISRHFAVAKKESVPAIKADFIPGITDEEIKERLSGFSRQKSLKNLLADMFLFPERFVDIFLQKINADPLIALKDIRADDMRRLIHEMRHTDLYVSGVTGYKKAEVTCGGLDLKEVHHSTMESRKEPGLYFVGEVLDVDGRIGGFNFQWAWSSGTVAGRAASDCLN